MPFDLTLAGVPTAPTPFTYTWKDAALYALGVGATPDELAWLYEKTEGGMRVLPSFAVVPTFAPMFDLLAKTGGDLSLLLHGTQRITLHRPFPADATVTTTAKVRDFYDLRRLAVVLVDTETKDAEGALIAETTYTLIFRGDGGFGGPTPPKEEKIAAPKGVEPTFVVEEATRKEQALLYRLNGDTNPLHADPVFAANVGFTQGPILHGLATYGFLARHVTRALAAGDHGKLRVLEAQFKKPVWPGDTLVTEGWQLESGKIALQVKVKERDEVVVTGFAELF